MRKLEIPLNLRTLMQIKPEIVPALFTKHQFDLLKHKITGKILSPSEKCEFSRAIFPRIKAIQALTNSNPHCFVYGKEKILTKRLKLAKVYLKQFSRKFKNQPVLISGSFLYQEKFNDIDVFIIEKYDKEDFKEGKFHFNYLPEEVYSSLFFSCLKKLCISNRPINESEIKETINLDTFISLYQEVFNDFAQNQHAVKETLRNYLTQSFFLKKMPLPDSQELSGLINSILNLKKPTEIIKKIFVETAVLSVKPQDSIPVMKQMIESNYEIMEEYPQHKKYYLDLISAFEEVISIES